MRTINADKLVVDARLGEDEIPYVSKAQIDEAPTVEAIPIEWINKWLKVCTKEEAYIITVMAYAWNLDEGQKRWEKENETN